MTTIRPLTAADRDEWMPLWHAYVAFYESQVSEAQTALTFRRLIAGDGIHGAIARDDAGAAVGFVNWLFHPATWSATTYCYLEDLFVSPAVRGGGVGRALIAHVRDRAKDAGAAKVYWLTHETNLTARALYDRVATRTGFVHYEIGL